MAIWTKHEIYLGYPKFKYEKILDISELKDVLKFGSTDEVEINYLAYTWHPLELAALVSYCSPCTTTKKIFLLLYNEDAPKWVLQDFQLEVPVDRTLKAYFLYSALPDLIVWDDRSIYYFYKNYSIRGILTAESGESNLSKLSGGSKIHNIISGEEFSTLTKVFWVSLYWCSMAVGIYLAT